VKTESSTLLSSTKIEGPPHTFVKDEVKHEIPPTSSKVEWDIQRVDLNRIIQLEEGNSISESRGNPSSLLLLLLIPSPSFFLPLPLVSSIHVWTILLGRYFVFRREDGTSFQETFRFLKHTGEKCESQIVTLFQDEGLSIELSGGPVTRTVGGTKKGGRSCDTIDVCPNFHNDGSYTLVMRSLPSSSKIVSVTVYKSDPKNGQRYDGQSFEVTREELETRGLIVVERDRIKKMKTGVPGFRRKEKTEIQIQLEKEKVWIFVCLL
jgi:hypothetical protein